ncbi:uncharacterized protein F4817DRAFT_1803 [Daldinia loculata]|uniref:uncharacterized protein n=1 Tax=Daldinia loculata TaxID=103429 RepID=UPI0020C3409B|nr:uncharacterized protein F4817DRAFT_1803 [Daldinia loculata]KAI1652047.1 hypothetical protein F4817DRAFT_1803 [Daldinia loculata]
MAMLGSLNFPLFAQLPNELRLLVWGQYALPRVPIYYARFLSYPPLRVESFQSNSMVRRLMQVNREARSAVLGNRQLYIFTNGRPYVISHQLAPFCENSPTTNEDEYGYNWTRQRYMFVDFKKDIFCFETIRLIETRELRLPDWLIFEGHIKNMTFDLSDAIYTLKQLSVPWGVLRYLESASKVLNRFIYPYLRLSLKSFRRLQFIIHPEDLLELYCQDFYGG